MKIFASPFRKDEIPYFKYWTRVIKEDLKASYVSMVKYKDSYFLKVIKDNITNEYPIGGTLNDITDKSFTEFLKSVKQHES